MKKNYFKLFALCMVAVVALFAFAGCGNDTDQNQGSNKAGDDESKVFIIGSIGPLTGGAASYGNSAKQGEEIAVAEINAAGGVAGYTFQLMPEDDQHDAEKAVSAYNTLMDKV